MRALIENSSDVIALVSPAGKVLCTSASAARLFGYFPAEIAGRNTIDMIHPEDRGASARALEAVLARPPQPRQVDLRVRRKNGDWCWVESTIYNLLNEPLAGALVVNCREIGARETERKQEQQQQTDNLVRANARLEDFAYAVAHDFREHLRTISMFTELLGKANLDARQRVHAEFVMDGVMRMAALLEDLHAFAITGFDKPACPVDLGRIVDEVLRNLGHAIATSQATVTVDPLPVVEGNEKHLLRVFQNLIANSIKYRSEAPVTIHLSAARRGQEWTIKVKDNGIGVSREHHERIFTLFKRLHGPETPGAGIGLAISKKIIEAMGGSLWVESEPGSGSIFSFTVAATKEINFSSEADYAFERRKLPPRPPVTGDRTSDLAQRLVGSALKDQYSL